MVPSARRQLCWIPGCLNSAIAGETDALYDAPRRAREGSTHGSRPRVASGECLCGREGTTGLRYLITGGAGFIGSHVADALVTRGDEVVILDDFSTGRRENLQHLPSNGAVDLVTGSVTDEALVDALISNCDCCLHFASAVGVKLVVASPLETLRRIVHGTDVVVSTAAKQHKRVLFASTSEVYGKNSDGALHEESDRVLGLGISRVDGRTRSRSPTARRLPMGTTANTVPIPSWSGCSTRSAHASAASTGWLCLASYARRFAART